MVNIGYVIEEENPTMELKILSTALLPKMIH